MNKNAIISIIIVAVLVVGAIWFFSNRDDVMSEDLVDDFSEVNEGEVEEGQLVTPPAPVVDDEEGENDENMVEDDGMDDGDQMTEEEEEEEEE
ncbi:MAG: hypothetical protein ACOCU8_02810 [Patescibacteria group bacterium]